MSQCVPSWDLDENPVTARHSLRSNSNSTAPDVPMSDYEVAELTWENGQLAMHSLGPPRVPTKPSLNSTAPTKYAWEKPARASGTLESIVNQATQFPYPTMTMDALVPCSNRSEDRTTHVMESIPGLGGTCVVGCSTRVGSCSGPAGNQEEEVLLTGKRAKEARVPVAPEWSSKDQSACASASATFGRDSQHVTVDTYEKDLGVGFTSTSPDNTSTKADDHDSREAGEEDKQKETGKSSVSTKRSRAAAIHNQSERKRRDKINQRMKTLQKLVPNSSKTDKASMLDEVIEYLKQLQAQVNMMSRMNMPPMMLPMTMQQQLQMSMMAPMGMGMGMGMGMAGMGVMDMNSMGRPNMSGISPVMPNPFMTMTSWDGSGDRLQAAAAASAAVIPDPLSAFLACQSQPMTMEAYSRMAAMYQQMQQPPASSSKS
ncbi:hypothetical protein CCACVL1_19455 [Corchorus capsularis]|uniref:BHLH domain-containing protein n=1 Tax=Corchorus capsularis TaxID=210143 RepID=A0A1R3HGU8_COCAP|nr:hypothetical protein CCACVL1_19455 [Corchorus capsularis]